MEKWMIVYVLPLEVWMDIFCFPWIKRREFGLLVERIGNFKFAELAQFYLHELGKRTLGEVWFDEMDGLYKHVITEDTDRPYRVCLDIPQTGLPENIKSFDSIVISHIDAKIMDFLGRIGSLMTGVGIGVTVYDIPEHLDNLRTALTRLVPILDGIHSLRCAGHTLPAVRQCLSRDVLAKIKWLRINIDVCCETDFTFIMDWLIQPHNEGPRLCLLRLCFDKAFFNRILRAIREQFLTAKTPGTFAVKLICCCRKKERLVEFHLENGIGEQLHGVRTLDGRVFQITRHPANCSAELQECINANRKGNCRIHMFNPTIGPIDTGAQIAEEGQHDQQHPSTSKDA